MNGDASLCLWVSGSSWEARVHTMREHGRCQRPESWEPFRSYSRYLRERYGFRVYRVGVDAGFSCPNRGNDRTEPGCTYCDDRGSRAPYARGLGVEEQIRQGIEFLRRRYKPDGFILYFQAFSSTYAPVAELRRLYSHCLSLHPFEELVVSTRPDCIDGDVSEMLGSFRGTVGDVWVELGLQSAHDDTLLRIRRGHSVGQFSRAFRLLRSVGVKITIHLVFGLPGEGSRRIMETVDFVSALEPDGVKIHNLHISRGAPMFAEFARGELVVPADLRHAGYVTDALERFPPKTVILRLTCDTPRSDRMAPRKQMGKSEFYATVRSEMRRRGSWQGKLWPRG